MREASTVFDQHLVTVNYFSQFGSLVSPAAFVLTLYKRKDLPGKKRLTVQYHDILTANVKMLTNTQ